MVGDALDFDGLALEHVRLHRRLQELDRQLERAQHRASSFPSEFGTHEVRKLKRDEQAILDRVAEISGLLILLPLRHAQ
jgi:hypothetical protein